MKRLKIIFAVSVMMLFISSSVIFALPYLQANSNRMLRQCLGAVFWGFLILAVVLFYFFPLKEGQDTEILEKPKRFFPNRPALIFDFLFALSAVINGLMFFVESTIWLQAAAMFTLVYSLEMHFIFHSKRCEILLKNRQNKNIEDEA